MAHQSDTAEDLDPFQLSRFLDAQQAAYPEILDELRRGRKQTHWMWFVFPQVEGLGSSFMARRYAIRSLAEARRYLAHPVLGARLTECSEMLLAIQGKSISEVMGCPDDVKLKSSMTLFAGLGRPDSVFARVLEMYFHGQRDARTIEFLRHGPDDGSP